MQLRVGIKKQCPSLKELSESLRGHVRPQVANPLVIAQRVGDCSRLSSGFRKQRREERVAAANRSRSVLSQGGGMPTHGRSGARHSNQSQRRRSARLNMSRLGKPRLPKSFGEHTLDHATLHLPPAVSFSSMPQTKRRQILAKSWMNFRGSLSTVMAKTSSAQRTEAVRPRRPPALIHRPF